MRKRMNAIIEELYLQHDEDKYQTATNKMLSISVPIDHASMMKVIADHFGTSVSALGGEILSDAIQHAYNSLRPHDRTKLSLQADVITSKDLEKQGVTVTHLTEGGEATGSNHWESLDKHLFGAGVTK